MLLLRFLFMVSCQFLAKRAFLGFIPTASTESWKALVCSLQPACSHNTSREASSPFLVGVVRFAVHDSSSSS